MSYLDLRVTFANKESYLDSLVIFIELKLDDLVQKLVLKLCKLDPEQKINRQT